MTVWTRTMRQTCCIAMAVCLNFGTVAGAQDEAAPALLPTGVVYQQARHMNLLTPRKMQIPGVDKFDHGTFETFPYYMIVQTNDGPILMTDGQFFAKMHLVSDAPRTRPRRDGSGKVWQTAQYTLEIERTSGPSIPGDAKPILTFNDAACGEVPCFTISGTGNFAELPSGNNQFTSYLPIKPRPDETSKDVTPWGSPFVPRGKEPRAYIYVCWDVTLLAYLDYQENPCNKAVLSMPVVGSRNYTLIDSSMALPWGWSYYPESYSGFKSTTTTIATSSDVMNSLQRTTGFNVSGEVDVSYGIVEASASFSYNQKDGMMQKFQNMHESNSIFTQGQFHSTQFALVVNKTDASLDPLFKEAVLSMVPQLADGTLSDQVLLDFLGEYGTHYAYAVTYGTQGSATTTYNEQQVSSLIESGANFSKAWEASVSVKVMGSGGKISGGSTEEGAQENAKKFEANTSEGATAYVCSGGASCDGGVPSGDPQIPVFLDLRPLSDLLGPPFFTDEAVVIGLRDRLQKAIKDHAFVELPKGAPDLAIGSLSVGSPLCNGVDCASAFPQSSISWSDMVLSAASPATLVPGPNGRLSETVSGGIAFDLGNSSNVATLLARAPTATLGGIYDNSVFSSELWSISAERANWIPGELQMIDGAVASLSSRLGDPQGSVATLSVTLRQPDYSALFGTAR